tara:strand:+ start:230 stop:1042 length:813 start_codon:yes stop_codon:yes gene_type:complete
MDKNVWLYFNVEADDNNLNVGADYTNGMFNAKNLIAMTPDTDTALSFIFKSMINDSSARHDFVMVTLKDANTHLDVIKNLTRAINNTSPSFDGFINVADALTTKVDGTTVIPKFITDNRQENGYISGVNKVGISWLSCGDRDRNILPGSGYFWAASGEEAANTLEQGGFYNVKSNNADHIILLPPTTLGTVVYLNCSDDNTGFELRAYNQVNQKINGGGGVDNDESAIGANVDLVRCVCVSGTGGTNAGKWICTQYTNAGVESAVEVADA